MRALGLMLCGSVVLPAGLAAAVQAPERLTAAGVSPAVWGVVEVPREAGSHPGVVLLHGSAGWRSQYAQLAKALADSGFVTLALDYYAEIGGAEARSEDKLRNWPRWQATVRSAVAYLRAVPSVSGRPADSVGYSCGGAWGGEGRAEGRACAGDSVAPPTHPVFSRCTAASAGGGGHSR